MLAHQPAGSLAFEQLTFVNHKSMKNRVLIIFSISLSY